MTLSPELTALRDEAMAVTCIGWAIQKRWPLSRVGIDRSGPCPKCGGTDRFSIHTKDDLFNCRQCGIAGHGVIDLVMQTEGVEFVAACEIITGRKAGDPVDAQRMAQLRRQAEDKERRRVADEARRRAEARAAGLEIWNAGVPLGAGKPVIDYLLRRAIDLGAHPLTAFGALRFAEKLPWMEEFIDAERGTRGWKAIEIAPAMLAVVRLPQRLIGEGDAFGSFGAVHMTWLDASTPKGRLVLPPDDSGRARPSKKVRGSKKGGAIQLFTPRAPRRLVMGEGIETTLTTLSAAFEPETAYWAGVDLGNMAGRALRLESGSQVHDEPDMDDLECFLPPEWCEELVYLGEGDVTGVRNREKCERGLKRAMRNRDAAIAAGAALKPLRGIYVPPVAAGKDMNDLAMEDQDGDETEGVSLGSEAAAQG